MTTRGAVACLCSEVLRDEELGGAPLLLDAGGVSMADRDPAKMAAERAAKFIFRGLLILLWLYLFDSMREYAINYTGGDIRFSTFAAIVVAVPIAEIFGIMGQTLVAPWSPRPPMGSPMPFTACATASANSEVLKEAPMMPADARRRKTATEAALDMAVVRIYICIVRGLLALLWVYLVDLMRRYMATHGLGELFFTMTPLLILAAGVSLFFCFLMESFRKFIDRHIDLCWN
ncbi:uncharacterized protein [Miscanthus floridulus]|uniref:uncharacterized protein n=1 Tax=Miscanthus floridulus TaxID=154761 RepID=UPI00345AC2E3